MTIYRIDPESGVLAALAQYPMGEMPNWIEIVDLQ
jgi:6-phosphogluconolactonase (cycloisomerase 2 family)